MACMTGKNDDDWVIDSGSTEHITHSSRILQNITQSRFETPVVIPNGDAIPVEGKGECTLPGGTKIKDVLHVPKFTCNLLSVSRLSKDLQSAITFFPDICVMQKLHTRSLIGAGECKRGLYRMGLFEDRRRAMMISGDTWHRRLGHASNEKLAYIDFLNKASFGKSCDSYSKAKHTRLPFSNNDNKTNDCFELLHCDIWGKYCTPSFSGASYFLTIVDDFSRAVWVFLLKFKYEASRCMINFHNMVKTQFGKTVKRIRCDNGGEFTSNEMTKFYNEQGIILETTCPHTPQQNGVVERKHRHLLEVARALRFESNTPKRFSGECVLTATYVINRLPSKVLGNKTPYEIVFGHKPDYDHMRIFGCLAYYRSTETKGDKFEMRGRPGVFLGYPQGTKGYKLYDIENKRIVTSRDVKFHESIFPFGKMNINQEEWELPFGPTYEEEPDPQEFVVNEEEIVTQGDDINSGPHDESSSDGFFDPPPQQTVENESRDTQHSSHAQVDECETIHDKGAEPVLTKRSRTQPRHLKDFVVQLPPSVDHAQTPPSQDSSTVHPLSNYVSYEKFSKSHKAFLAAIDSNDEPKFFHQAVKDERWKEAM